MTFLTSTTPISLAYLALMVGTVAFIMAIFIIFKYDLKSKSASKSVNNQ